MAISGFHCMHVLCSMYYACMYFACMHYAPFSLANRDCKPPCMHPLCSHPHASHYACMLAMRRAMHAPRYACTSLRMHARHTLNHAFTPPYAFTPYAVTPCACRAALLLAYAWPLLAEQAFAPEPMQLQLSSGPFAAPLRVQLASFQSLPHALPPQRPIHTTPPQSTHRDASPPTMH